MYTKVEGVWSKDGHQGKKVASIYIYTFDDEDPVGGGESQLPFLFIRGNEKDPLCTRNSCCCFCIIYSIAP